MCLVLVGRISKMNGRHLHVAPKQECIDMTHLESCFQDIIDQGGEGIILRDPMAPYKPGRSLGYLKHKVISRAKS